MQHEQDFASTRTCTIDNFNLNHVGAEAQMRTRLLFN